MRVEGFRISGTHTCEAVCGLVCVEGANDGRTQHALRHTRSVSAGYVQESAGDDAQLAMRGSRGRGFSLLCGNLLRDINRSEKLPSSRALTASSLLAWSQPTDSADLISISLSALRLQPGVPAQMGSSGRRKGWRLVRKKMMQGVSQW